MIRRVADDVVRDEMTLDASSWAWCRRSPPRSTILQQHDARPRGPARAARPGSRSLLSHELRTPISVILGALQTLHDCVDRHRHRPTRRRLTVHPPTACRSATSSAACSSDGRWPRAGTSRTWSRTCWAPTRSEGPTFTRAVVRRVRLGDLTDQACTAVSGSLPASRVHREIDDDVEVSTAPSASSPSSSTCSRTPPSTAVRTSWSCAPACRTAQLVVEVADRGPGLRGEAVERLFEPFSRGARGRRVPGSRAWGCTWWTCWPVPSAAPRRSRSVRAAACWLG